MERVREWCCVGLIWDKVSEEGEKEVDYKDPFIGLNSWVRVITKSVHVLYTISVVYCLPLSANKSPNHLSFLATEKNHIPTYIPTYLTCSKHWYWPIGLLPFFAPLNSSLPF
ncbi:hypothetical protein VNO77_00053 [Canavalia gladiata]|uniref:Uncharacterized protein n=1 Tax=Canavalia gladiata TaxID=3824 RepID=A0AAN9MTX7_CANGL